MDHPALDGARPDDRDLDHEVVEARGTQPRQHRLLRARLDLEHADRVGALAHRVDGGVLGRDVLHAHRHAAEARDHVERAADRREHPEREAVDLEQAHRVEVVLVPLDDRAVGHRGVLDRHHPLEQPAGDDEAADVLRQVAGKSHEVAGERDEPHDERVVGIEARLADARGLDAAAVPPREHAGQPVDLRQVEAQRLADVADRALRPVRDERGGERRAVAAVLAVHVLHDLLAPLVLEVDVDVGRLVPLAADEALEQHAHPRRVDLGDAERVADGRVGGRAAALAQDALRPRERDDVLDGEEVRLVIEFRDQGEFVLDQFADLGRRGALAVAAGEAGFDQRAQVRRGRRALRHQLLGVFVAQLVEREAAARDDVERRVGELARVERGEPRARAQVALAVPEERVAALGQRRTQADGGQRVLQRAAGAHVHVHVAGGDQRQAGRARQRLQRREPRAVAGAREEFRGDPRAAGEDVGEPARVVPEIAEIGVRAVILARGAN